MHRDLMDGSNVELKVGIVSSSAISAQHVREVLENWDRSLRLSVNVGGLDRAAHLADEEKPDVLLFEGGHHDKDELTRLEVLTARHPRIAAMLLSANQSADFLRHAMRVGVREVLPMPLARETLIEAIGRARQRAAKSAAPERRGRILSFVGCKGGSGATFLATNLAYTIAEATKTRVALIDLNLLGDAALYVTQQSARATVADVLQQVHRLDGALLSASMIHVLPDFHLLPSPEDSDRLTHIRPENIEPLLTIAASHYDLVIIDAGRSLDDVMVRALDRSDSIFAVLQLNLPFLRNAKRVLHALTELNYAKEKVKLLVNRFEKRAPITLDDLAATLKHEVFRTIPNSFTAVAASIDQGVPVAKLAPRDSVAKALRELAGVLVDSKQEQGWLRAMWPRG
jgi:pilus assembly protein CpaE